MCQIDGDDWWGERTNDDKPYSIDELINVPLAPPGSTEPTHYLCYVYQTGWQFVHDIRAGAETRDTPVELLTCLYSDLVAERGIRAVDDDQHAKYLEADQHNIDNQTERRKHYRVQRLRHAVRG